MSADELEKEESTQSHERALELAKQKVSAQKETEAAVATEEAGEEYDATPIKKGGPLKKPATWMYVDSAARRASGKRATEGSQTEPSRIARPISKKASYTTTWKPARTLYR